RRQEERIVFAPHGQDWGLLRAKIFLELWIQSDVAGVVEKQVKLDLIVPGSSQQRGIELVGFRRDQRGVLDPMCVLPLGRFTLKEVAQRRAVRRYGLFPISLDRVPAFAQSLFISIPVLRDDSRNTLRVRQCEPESYGCSVVEHVNRNALQANCL